MKLDNWETTQDLNEIYADVRRLGLEQSIAEHDAFGFTVIPPDQAASKEFRERLKRALLEVHQRRSGQHIHLKDISTADLRQAQKNQPLAKLWQLIGEDAVFEEALMNPVVHTLARYFLGKSVVVSEIVGALKQADPTPTHLLHTDQIGTPPPLPQYPQFLNITWALTDYTRENGALAIVPGSHRFGRMPQPYEADHLNPNNPVPAIPVECEAGSLIVWGGTTWHGSYPRTAPGLRIALIMTFCRSYMKQIRDTRATVSPEVLARNSKEFARLVGFDSAYPIGDFPDPEHIRAFVGSGRSQWS